MIIVLLSEFQLVIIKIGIFFRIFFITETEWSLCGAVANVLDGDIVVSEFRLQSHNIIYFRTNILGKGMNPFIPSALDKIVLLLFFYKNGFAITLPIYVNMPLNKWIICRTVTTIL